ncbi:polysaccharide deacetylase family protein [Desulfoluna butyratoxydans]|uniref:Glycoside hydrolase/deacetylase beta/alpha-barrel n=1 Tax=Desulfoluna butyratoxydans TaxID=231438 RepID=A0A4U8YLF5_9BACT|nr:polysaccharide deacetylase family protein [Desulfoluna butyratoxydans]VFQ44460.1 glycoside hydrolase/deacetylase beta/alpha-barrel [Desulfoluna butyratoxydans]
MTVHVYITIDTEEDSWDTYHATDNPVENLARIPELQRLFDRYGAVPTYLINWPVATDDRARDILKGIYDDGRCEIGTHCHPWNTPPHDEEISVEHSMMCNLPEALVKQKMTRLHGAIEERFHLSPVCFRAGRWGFDAKVARTLKALGYRIDTSISPFVDWSAYSGPDFSRGLSEAYPFDPDRPMVPDPQGALLEVPPTVGFYQKNGRLCYALMERLRKKPLSRLRLLGILDRLRLLNFRWLSPELSSGAEMVRLAKQCVRFGHRFLNMSFHSTSMLPGKSPFVDSEEDLARFLADIEMFLDYAAGQGFVFSPLCEALEAPTLREERGRLGQGR